MYYGAKINSATYQKHIKEMETMRYEIDELINGYTVVVQRSIKEYKKVFLETKLEALELIKNDIEAEIKNEMRVRTGGSND